MHLDLTSTSAGASFPAAEPIPHQRSLCRLGFALFLLLNGVLFVRPAEIVPALIGLPIYEGVIGTCLLASLPAIAARLTWTSLSTNLAMVCTLCLLPAVVLSHLTHGNLWWVRESAIAFGKVILYYLLLVALIDSWSRLRTLLWFILVFVIVTAVLALLQYHEVIHIEALTPLEQRTGDAEVEDVDTLLRLQASGIFNDPNDFSLILTTGMLVCAHQFLQTKAMGRRLFWLLPLPLLGYAFALTHSRGGFLALVAGLATLMSVRFGWRKTLLMAAVFLPVLLVVFAGRQTNIDLDAGDTAHGRVLLWRDSLVLLHGDPVRGIGFNMITEEVGHPAHNSFIHSFTELGLIGGTLFIGAFYVAIEGSRRLGSTNLTPGSPAAYWRPCILAIVTAYAVGLCSLSRSYVIPTYVVLGLGAVYLRLAGPRHVRGIVHVGWLQLRRVALVAAGCLLFFEVFVRVVA